MSDLSILDAFCFGGQASHRIALLSQPLTGERFEVVSKAAAEEITIATAAKLAGGPIRTEKGVQLIHVIRRFPAELTSALRAQIRDQLFTEWLDEQCRGTAAPSEWVDELRSNLEGSPHEPLGIDSDVACRGRHVQKSRDV